MSTKHNHILNSILPKSKITSANVKPKEAIIGYLLGPIFAILSNAIFGSYLNRYYTDVIGITDPSYGVFATLLPIITVIFIITGNLLIGRLIDHTRTHAGKARPYLLIAAPIIVLSIALLFLIPRGNITLEIIWISISYNLYYSIAFPLYFTSHSSMVALSTRNSKHRGILSTFSNASMVAAVGLGASILVPFLLQDYLFVKDEFGTVIANNSFNHWKIVMIFLASITLVGIILEYLFTRERITEETVKLNITQDKIPMMTQLKAVVSQKYWWIIILYFLLFQFGGVMKNSSMTYFSDYVLKGTISGGTAMGLLGLIGGIPTAIGMVIAWPIAHKLGKKNAVVIGLIISVIGGLVSYIDTSNFYIVVTGIVIKGIGSIPAMYVTLALLSDVLDHLEAKNGYRSDGITMAVYSSIMIGMIGLANGIINGLLSINHYDASLGINQPHSVESVMTFSFLAIEIICYAIIVVLMLFLNVEKHIKDDHHTILENQKAAVLAHGGTWVEPEIRLLQEQEETDRIAEENRVKELLIYCKRKNKNFEELNNRYLMKKNKVK